MQFKKILLCLLILLNLGVLAQDTSRVITPGKFTADWASLENGYEVPEWFRNAKFGIWAHWTAQCVPEDGDWYARHMYIQGTGQNKYHVARYGHPSKFGMMELDHLWKADKWDPEKLMALYKKAGARYFMALANHHDNFDAYNSTYHEWNSVRVGPKKDIVGTWEKLARKNGLYFGVSNHSAHAWHWLQTAYGYDGEGPQAGVRYDAYTLKKEDGKGKWWEGLDPQVLYTGNTIPMPDGIKGMKKVAEWHEKNDRPWMEHAPENNPAFTKSWFLRCKELVDQYKPDMLYFDNFGLPLGQAGLDITAHYYNTNMQQHDGKLQCVVTAKELTGNQNKGVVEDFERSSRSAIEATPWQTCTCIGEWHYNKKIYDEDRYKSAEQVLKMLVDIVSKNGNLLLSIPMKGDGTIDDKEVAILERIASWMKINGEAIFDTRPWREFGEGPTQVNTGMFSENKNKPLTSADIRFTSKAGILYAFVMGQPLTKTTVIKSLPGSREKVKEVSLLGYTGKLSWKQTEKGLEITWPRATALENMFTLKINYQP